MSFALVRCFAATLLMVPLLSQAADPPFVTLFPADGPVSAGWIVGHWSDVANPPPKEPAFWTVRDGNLWGGKSKSGRWVGTWLMSEQEYGDFILEVAFKFMNGGAQLTGALYLVHPPRVQMYLSGDWNE